MFCSQGCVCWAGMRVRMCTWCWPGSCLPHCRETVGPRAGGCLLESQMVRTRAGLGSWSLCIMLAGSRDEDVTGASWKSAGHLTQSLSNRDTDSIDRCEVLLISTDRFVVIVELWRGVGGPQPPLGWGSRYRPQAAELAGPCAAGAASRRSPGSIQIGSVSGG